MNGKGLCACGLGNVLTVLPIIADFLAQLCFFCPAVFPQWFFHSLVAGQVDPSARGFLWPGQRECARSPFLDRPIRNSLGLHLPPPSWFANPDRDSPKAWVPASVRGCTKAGSELPDSLSLRCKSGERAQPLRERRQ